VDDSASVADWVVYGGDTANCYVCEPKYFMKQTDSFGVLRLGATTRLQRRAFEGDFEVPKLFAWRHVTWRRGYQHC